MRFYKMTGSGNDFVMLDGREHQLADWPAQPHRGGVCPADRGRGRRPGHPDARGRRARRHALLQRRRLLRRHVWQRGTLQHSPGGPPRAGAGGGNDPPHTGRRGQEPLHRVRQRGRDQPAAGAAPPAASRASAGPGSIRPGSAWSGCRTSSSWSMTSSVWTCSNAVASSGSNQHSDPRAPTSTSSARRSAPGTPMAHPDLRAGSRGGDPGLWYRARSLQPSCWFRSAAPSSLLSSPAAAGACCPSGRPRRRPAASMTSGFRGRGDPSSRAS